MGKAREHCLAGHHRVVELDLEKFFDRVNHDKMMSLVRERIADRRVRRLIRRYLQAGMLTGEVYIPRSEGTPQGGPLSPLLANLLLDQLDQELEQRGHRFVRYADDVSIYVKSERAGRRVLQSISDYLTRRQYFNYAFNKQTFRELTAWIKRRLRCYMWKQWGRAGYRELRKRGVSRQLAWNTSKSHHGPWRLSRSPALAYALTTGYFVAMGLPLLHVNV